MASLIRRQLTFANLVSIVALAIALGGAAYAVTVAPKNSVRSKSVKNETLKGKDIKDEKLTGADVKRNSLDGSDVDERSLAQVPEAANAETVNGHRAACPADTVEHLGWCFDSAANPENTFLGAMDECNAKGGNLPSLGQLRSIRALDGIDLSDPDVHWADAPFQDGGGANRAMTFNEGQVVDDAPFAAANSYRCVYTLLR
jgi:hypothetical protein